MSCGIVMGSNGGRITNIQCIIVQMRSDIQAQRTQVNFDMRKMARVLMLMAWTVATKGRTP